MAKYALRAFGAPVLYSDDGSYFVTISGQPLMVVAGSLSVEQSVGRRSQASFTVKTNNTVSFQQYQQTAIYDGNTNLIFSGYITSPKMQKPGFQSSLVQSITCVDQHYLADKRRVTASYTNKTCGYMVYDIWKNVLSQEGVTIGAIYDGLTPGPLLYPGPTVYPGGNVGLVPSATFVYAKVSDAYDALATQASAAGVPYYWMIDQLKRLWFVPYTWMTNASIVDGTTIDQVFNPPSLTNANPTYRNTQYGVGGTQQTLQQTEQRKGDGSTQAWTMGYDLAQTPTITVDSALKTVGIKGVDSGKDFYWAQGDPIVAQDTSATKLTSSNTLQIVYYGQYPSVAILQNAAQIAYQASLDGTSGIVEDVDQDATQTSLANTISKLSQLLTKYAVQASLLEFYTKVPGYTAGQLITVNLPDFSLNNVQMLIEDVIASDQTDNYNIWYDVKCIVGPYDNNWIAFFSKLLAQQQPASSINVGTSQSVTLLAPFSASLSLTATLTATVYACPLPSTSLLPSTLLFPC